MDPANAAAAAPAQAAPRSPLAECIENLMEHDDAILPTLRRLGSVYSNMVFNYNNVTIQDEMQAVAVEQAAKQFLRMLEAIGVDR
jgi:hypothetical protein